MCKKYCTANKCSNYMIARTVQRFSPELFEVERISDIAMRVCVLLLKESRIISLV